MTSPIPLQGIELIDCARANAKQGIETAAKLCGYGTDLTTFQQSLQDACQDIGVEITELSDLIKDPYGAQQIGIDISPGSDSEL